MRYIVLVLFFGSSIFAANCWQVGQFFEKKMKENHTALYRYLDGEKVTM